MQAGKIGVCAAVFIVFLLLGAMAHERVGTSENRSGLKLYETKVNDERFSHPPFEAREYVRIIRTAAHNERVQKDAASERPGRMQWSEMQRRYEGAFVLSATREERKVALTFDDVPDPRFTPQVLDVLKQKQVKATFFIVGTRAKKHPELVRRIHREGHAIGNHSYSHPDLSRVSLPDMQKQIDRAEQNIEAIVGFQPKLVRPPYGEILTPQLEWAKEAGYTVVNWDVDSSDWRQLSEAQVFRNVTGTVRPGSIVLMHAGGGEGQSLAGTVRALPRIIDWLQDNDYEPVTLPQLLGVAEQRNMDEPPPVPVPLPVPVSP